MTEISTLLLTKQRQLFGKSCALPFAPHSAIARASNKCEMVDLARSLGVPVPASITLQTPDDPSWSKQALDFPIVIKPSRSRVLTSTGWKHGSTSYAEDPQDLNAQLRELSPELFPVLLQERISGPGRGIFMLFWNGLAVAHFAHRRVREKPPSGGVSVLCESHAASSEVLQRAELLLSTMNWHGPAMVEFKEDSRDGSLKLMEINARFWGSLQLAIDSGIDFPALMVDLVAGVAIPERPTFREGVQLRWLSGDLDALTMTILKSPRSLNLPEGHPGKLKSMWSFAKFFGKNLHYEIEQLDDIRPAIHEWRHWLTGT